MRRTFHQAIIFPCLCCFSFFSGNLLVGETEARFLSQVKAEPLEISAAFVFPSTIKQLEDSAEEIIMGMKETYQTTLSSTPGGTLGELQVQLSKITASGQNLNIQLDNLNRVFEELSFYKNQIQEQDQYEYVHEGFRSVESLRNEVQATIDFSKIEAIRSIVLLKIKELELNNKQVIKNDEKTLEGSE
ncbi:DUF4047 domain-containing protein [Neobacillus drentensis]|uniref:DUF4047 domain-containing protein n=1 Tax=Neobacillus drentensis TaxID=220684 RepID=UPI002FFFFCFE